MTDGKIKVVTGGKAIELTRYLMSRYGMTHDVAYHKLCGMKLFELLSDPETRLYLENDDFEAETFNTAEKLLEGV